MTILPKIVPVVAKPRAAAFDNDGWLFELKYDGFCTLLEIDGTDARLVSRNRNRFKHLDTLAAAPVKRLRVTDAILDGEIICADETGRPIFIEMLRGQHPFSFVAFDLLWLNGEDLRCRSSSARRGCGVYCGGAPITSSPRRWCGKALMVAVEEHDLEGIVAKRKADPYRRKEKWWKIKHSAQADEGRGELLNGDMGARSARR